VVDARVNEEAVEPAYVDGTAVVFVAPPLLGNEKVLHWKINIKAAPEYVDVLTFASAP
jgi:hypothetical protein